MNTATEDKAYGVANMIADKLQQCHIRRSDAETEATTWRLADPDRVNNQREREIYGITSNEQKQFKMKFFIRLIEFEAWWETIGILALRKTIEQHVIHFGYPKMHLVSHISKSIWQKGSSDNFTTDISERLHIANVKVAYWSSNKVNYIQQMLHHNDQCSSLEYMEKPLSYLALEGWYENYSATILNLLSDADKRQSTLRADLLRLQPIQDEPIICSALQPEYHSRETHVHRVCRSIKFTSLSDASEDFEIPNFGQLFRTQIDEDWGHHASGLVLRYDQNVLIDSIFMKLQNGLLY